MNETKTIEHQREEIRLLKNTLNTIAHHINTTTGTYDSYNDNALKRWDDYTDILEVLDQLGKFNNEKEI